MIAWHLIRVALENLLLRRGRTAFLVLGVAVGVASLAFLLAVYRGLDGLVRSNLAAHRAVMAQRAVLTQNQEALVGTLPLARLVVRAKAGSVAEADLTRWLDYAGVVRAEPIAFLFPVILGATPVALEIPGVPENELRREAKFPTTLYGVPADYVTPEELLPGMHFTPVDGEAPDPEGRVPVLLPGAFLEFLASLRSDAMVERSSEVIYSRLERRMQKRPKEREDLMRRLGQLPGVTTITDAVIKKVIREGMRKFLEQLTPESLPENFELALYPGLEEGSQRIPLEVVGFSKRISSQGIAVSIDHLRAWNQSFHAETSGALSSLFSAEPETAYAEVVLHTTGFQASTRLRARLRAEGFSVDSSLDEALRVEAELAALSEEAAKIAAEASRVDDLSAALGRGAAIVSALLFLLAGTVIVNGLTLSVLEQQRRIGIFRAVGATRLAVLGIFLFEAAVVGALGAALGLTLALGSLRVAAPYLAQGLAPATAHDPATLFALGPGTLLTVFALGTGVSLLAGLLPALRAASVQPVDVLKH
ncbi:MAG: ABC transporter permease [Planctomycetes bacterium]|nr:ABC transporter permease [Planctomycetota bacterium]